MQIQLKLFGRLREVLQSEGERITLPSSAATVDDVLGILRERGGVWAEELAEGKALAFAVAQKFVRVDAAIQHGDEVAIFPPVTGG